MTSDLVASVRPLLCGDFGARLVHLDEIDSTNSEALRLAADPEVPEGTVVVADSQTAGRGRWGRTWVSEPGKSLTFSILLRPTARPDLITTCVGVAVTEAVRELTGVDAGLKWPNDVVVDGRKLAGILVESQTDPTGGFTAVAGIGINLQDPPSEVAAPVTSLANVSLGPAPARHEVLAAVLSWFEPLYRSLGTQQGANQIVDRASELSTVLGKEVTLAFADGHSQTGMAIALDPSGALIVGSSNGSETFRAGEITSTRVVPGRLSGDK
jgi:BirA family transcriptional regulator, biotin operon repressor / biotin---[acetyl-CoA-carboxylase] ligase